MKNWALAAIGLSIFTLVAIFFFAMAAIANDGASDRAVDRWIARQAHGMKGVERRRARYSVIGDLDGDGRDDVAVLYTIKGTGKFTYRLRYLAVFHRGPHSLRYLAHTLVGGRGIREVDRATILRRSIKIETLEYRHGDALCCPSRYTTRRYRLKGGRLVLQKPAARVAAPNGERRRGRVQ